MRMKKVLQGTALTALAAAALAGTVTADASAAEKFPFNNVKFNLDGYAEYEWEDEDGEYYYDEYPADVSMNITAPEGSKEIMVGVASFKNGAVKIADTAWEVHDVKDEDEIVYVDLSKLSVTKDNYIAVKSDSTDPVFFRIGASITKLGFNYNAGTNTLTFKDGMKTGTNASSLNKDNTTLMYRTSFSPWSEVDCYTYTGEKPNRTKTFNDKNVVFQEYQYQGATVYLRTAGIENDMTQTDNKLTNVKDANDKSTTPAEYDLYNAGYMPSKEVKLNIAKQANGPSVKGDYVNGKVNIPANTQYRVIASGGAISGTTEKPYESTTAKATPTVSELLKLANGEKGTATSGTIEVRKAPVTTGKGKAASKWTRVAIETPDKIDITGATKGDKEFLLGENVDIEATGGAITLSNKIKIEVTTAASGSKKGQVNGVKVTVPSEVKYDVSVDVGAKKPTIVQSSKDKTIKVNAGTTIKIGKAGNAKSKAWASGTVTIGKTK